MIREIDNGRYYWGQENKEPVVIIEDIPLSVYDIEIIGKNQDTMKFNFNGITYIKFKIKNLAEQLQTYPVKMNITVAGKPSMNFWGGRSYPQILIDEIEIKEQNEFDF